MKRNNSVIDMIQSGLILAMIVVWSMCLVVGHMLSILHQWVIKMVPNREVNRNSIELVEPFEIET